MIIATIFVTLPFVVREVEPVLHEIGDEQEQAAATLGARRQTFWRITLPSIRWGLSTAWSSRWRARWESSALIVVAGGVSGESQTLTLLVQRALHRLPQHLWRVRRGHRPDGAGPAAALVLMTL